MITKTAQNNLRLIRLHTSCRQSLLLLASDCSFLPDKHVAACPFYRYRAIIHLFSVIASCGNFPFLFSFPYDLQNAPLIMPFPYDIYIYNIPLPSLARVCNTKPKHDRVPIEPLSYLKNIHICIYKPRKNRANVFYSNHHQNTNTITIQMLLKPYIYMTHLG